MRPSEFPIKTGFPRRSRSSLSSWLPRTTRAVARFVSPHGEFEDPAGLRPPVDEVAQEDEPPAAGVRQCALEAGAVAERVEERGEFGVAGVYVAHEVEWAPDVACVAGQRHGPGFNVVRVAQDMVEGLFGLAGAARDPLGFAPLALEAPAGGEGGVAGEVLERRVHEPRHGGDVPALGPGEERAPELRVRWRDPRDDAVPGKRRLRAQRVDEADVGAGREAARDVDDIGSRGARRGRRGGQGGPVEP